MALIKCSECQQEVSENATSCPHCGNPLKANTVNIQTTSNQRVEVELTNKKWKKIMLVSIFVIIAGFIIPAFLSGSSSSKHGLGWTIVILGFIGLVVGKIGAWYSNR